MENTHLLVRYGDLMLKGRNRSSFIKTVNRQIKYKLKKLPVTFDWQHDRLTIVFPSENLEEVVKTLETISGLHSYSEIRLANKSIDDIVLVSAKLINEKITSPIKFKVETKRSDKSYPLTSPDVTLEVSKKLLPKVNNILVDVKNPDEILHIDIRHDYTYIYLTSNPLMGGFPAGIAGKGLVLLSGGIDSPVSAYLAMKQGLEVELFHFESTPLTPIESAQKAIEISKKLSLFTPRNNIKLHMVPFYAMHEAILKNVDENYTINIMRRMMYRAADIFAKEQEFDLLINGDSLGQVASQTVLSMDVVSSVSNTLIIRPVITYDKQEIIKISKKIDTYNISILPFNDCCSIYVPRNPIIKPSFETAIKNENRFDYQPLLDDMINSVMTFNINIESDIELALYGITVPEAYESYKEEKNEL